MFRNVVWQHVLGVVESFNNRFTANLLENLPVNEFWKSVKIWQRYYHEYGVSLVWWNIVYKTSVGGPSLLLVPGVGC